MTYYKLIDDGVFIGVGTSTDLRRFQTKHRIILSCDESQAQYICFGGELYRASWMLPVCTDTVSCRVVEVVPIEENEYSIFKQADESDNILIEEDEVEVTTAVADDTLEALIAAKISEMSTTCRLAITDGFSVVLSDGEKHHFSLTTQDQLNLMGVMAMVAAGETSIPYHADGELFCYYAAEDIITINTAATEHKTYHTVYFNSLKSYIKSLGSVSEIADITYGVDVPEEFRSEVLNDCMTG